MIYILKQREYLVKVFFPCFVPCSFTCDSVSTRLIVLIVCHWSADSLLPPHSKFGLSRFLTFVMHYVFIARKTKTIYNFFKWRNHLIFPIQ